MSGGSRVTFATGMAGVEASNDETAFSDRSAKAVKSSSSKRDEPHSISIGLSKSVERHPKFRGSSETQRTPMRDPIVTMSWDDGHSMDLRVAELLANHGLKASFYVAFNHPDEKAISDDEIRILHGMGMEIGSHTLTHQLVTGRPAGEVRYELSESKMRLEDILGAPVTSFSYPQGAFNAVVRAALVDTGYQIGRSTVAFRTAYDFDPLLMPISLEFCRYSRLAIVRHAMRDGNLAGLANWASITGLETDPLSLGQLIFDSVSTRGGIFHLTARSWEVDANGLWDQLKVMVRYIAEHPAIRRATNSEVPSFHD